MTKVKPYNPKGEESFDGLDELHNVQYDMHKGAHSKRRVKKKVTTRLDDKPSHRDIVGVLWDVTMGKHSIHIGAPFTLLGLFVAMLTQLKPTLGRYNAILTLALSAAVEFQRFPAKSVRAQLALTLAAVFSCGLDIFQIFSVRDQSALVVAIVAQTALKLCLLVSFLRNSQGAVKTRKYLDRRVRLFVIPLYQPRRIMRDVRGRIVAIGWMQFVGAVCFAVLFVLYMVYLDFTALYLGTERSASIPTFLLFKTASCLLVFSGVLYDADVRLCLWHFGCMSCFVNYIRNYITRQRIALKGFPLMYAFSKYRFQVVQFLKFLDVAWGVYGWVILSRTFGTEFYSIGRRLQAFSVALAFCLVVFDLWVISLFFGVRWLLRRYDVLLKLSKQSGESVDSDDSEIEEFGLRANLEARMERDQDKAALAEARRKLYFLRVKEEETRIAEEVAARSARGRAGLAGAADWLQEQFVWAPKTSNVIHPEAAEGRAPLRGGEWEIEGREEHEPTQSHPLLKHLQSDAVLNNADRGYDKYDAFWKDMQEPLQPHQTSGEASATQPIVSADKADAAQAAASKKKGISWGLSKPRVHPQAESKESEKEDSSLATMSPLALRHKIQSDQRRLNTPSTTSTEAPAKSAAPAGTILDRTFTMQPEEFAGIWDLLKGAHSSRLSTVRIPAALFAGAQDSAPLRQHQLLLTAVVKHLRVRGFSVSSAGLHDQRVVRVYCFAKVAPTDQSAPSSVTSLGLLELQLYPGAEEEDPRQAFYLLECVCRCQDADLRNTYLSMLRLDELLHFID